MKTKKCKVCSTLFEPTFNAIQPCCSIPCLIIHGQNLKAKRLIQKAKDDRKEYRDAKIKQKTRRDYLKEAQTIYNKYIRARDEGKPCISCQRHHEGQWHCGHYMPTSTRPSLRFTEINTFRQCSACNTHLHGNLINYRINLINEIGIDKVEWLEGEHSPAKWTIPELQSIIAEYKAKLKALT